MLFANVTDKKLLPKDLDKLNISSTGIIGDITDLSAELVLILWRLADQFTNPDNGEPLFDTKEEVKNYFLKLLDLAIDIDEDDPLKIVLSNADAPKEKKFVICKSIIPFLPSPFDVLTPIILQNNDGEFDMEETVRFFDKVLVPAYKDIKNVCSHLFKRGE